MREAEEKESCNKNDVMGFQLRVEQCALGLAPVLQGTSEFSVALKCPRILLADNLQLFFEDVWL